MSFGGGGSYGGSYYGGSGGAEQEAYTGVAGSDVTDGNYVGLSDSNPEEYAQQYVQAAAATTDGLAFDQDAAYAALAGDNASNYAGDSGRGTAGASQGRSGGGGSGSGASIGGGSGGGGGPRKSSDTPAPLSALSKLGSTLANLMAKTKGAPGSLTAPISTAPVTPFSTSALGASVSNALADPSTMIIVAGGIALVAFVYIASKKG